jgi:capsular exopolysaccharide synthesis family protein
MERIQEAIAKARAERQGKVGKAPAVGSQSRRLPDGPVVPGVQRPGNFVGKTNEVVEIAYSKTRAVDVDESQLKENRVIAGFNYDDRVESYRQLRTRVLKMLRDNNWNTLAITSAHENAGKTLTAVNLAISMSREVTQTVLLVDLDLCSPSVHEALGIEVEKGIVDYLQDNVPLEEILVNPGYQRLVVLPGRAQGQYASEILSSPGMMSLLDDIKNRYESRIVIFDLPPLLRNDDALIFAPKADATLLVVEDGVTSENDLRKSMRLLEGSNLVGSILNKAR